MARRGKKGRAVNGIFLLDKPLELSSNSAMQRVRRLFDANKAGHTGALDPLATGLLPICLGEATKFSQYLLDSDKRYTATFALGVATESGDRDGAVVSQASAAHLTEVQVVDAMASFEGETDQVPSMFSALKHNGQPLYKLARQGIEVERPARRITLHHYRLLAFRSGEVAEIEVDVHCSKGTYVRTLATDLGELLGVGAHVTALRRTAAGPFALADAYTPERLTTLVADSGSSGADHTLLPMEIAVQGALDVQLPKASELFFSQGQPVAASEAYRNGQEAGIVRVFAEDGRFLGVATVTDDGLVAPKRLVLYPTGEKD
ncbi:tRNA pseudouridine(55) synthase TruB [Porticoccaceae bacterium]|nr:tRNA pseudouridine(55) synthase TruB [Porticoccaceae bacterium]